MEIIIVYIAFATFSIVFAGAVLLLIDHYLETKRDERRAALVSYMIPKACDEFKRLSIETIEEMNHKLYQQFGIDEKEDN